MTEWPTMKYVVVYDKLYPKKNSSKKQDTRCASRMGSIGDFVLNLLLHLIVRNSRVLLIFKTDDQSIVSYIYLPFETEHNILST